MADREKKKSNKGTAAFVIIVVLIVFGLIVGLALWFESEDQKMIDKGCTPKAWNSLGHPSIWSCPIK
jgi:hypothetical protein